MFDRTEHYQAEVIAYNPDRVTIRRVCPKNVTATPTLALWGMFTNKPGGYTIFDWK